MASIQRLVLTAGLALAAALLLAQSRADHSPDYGFQVVERYLPDEAPLGYTSLAITKLTSAMVAGRTYHLRYTLRAEPSTFEKLGAGGNTGYALSPIVIPTTSMELPYEYAGQQDDVRPAADGGALSVPEGTTARQKRDFEVAIVPAADYRYLTFLLPEANLRGKRLEPRVDIAITGIYLDVEPEARAGINLAALPWRAAPPVSYRRPPTLALPRIGAPAPAAPHAELPLATREHARPRKRHDTRLDIPVRSVRIGLYDNKRVDGDIVTMLLDGRVLVQSHRLTEEPVYFDVALAPGESTFVLHAENLGAVVPNTAAVIFEGEGYREEVVLSSDLETSEYVELRVR